MIGWNFVIFFEWKIKRINNADLFSQPPLLIFTKGANISGGHCISVLIGVVQNMSRLECLTEERRHKKWMGKICTELQTDEKVSSNCGWLLLFWLPLNQVLKHTHTHTHKTSLILFFSGLSDDLHFLSFKEFRNRTLGTQCMTLLKATLCVRNREKIITPFQCNRHLCLKSGVFVCLWQTGWICFRS